LQAILKAGIFAPNGGNTQLWHFTVLQTEYVKELNELIRNAFAKNAGSDNRFIKGAAKQHRAICTASILGAYT